MKFTDKKIKEGLQNIGTAVRIEGNACKDMRAFLLSKAYEDKRSELVLKEKIKTVRDWMGLNWVTVRVATISMIVLSVIGGSISTVSASLQSLPGDFLFPVKITTEKIQIAFKTNEDSKTKLKVEFAGRRLEEAKVIIESESPEREERAVLAMANFKTQIENIQKDMASAEPKVMAETAKMVVKRTNEYQETINKAIQDMPAIKENAEMVSNTIVEMNAEAEKVAIKVIENMDDANVVENEKIVVETESAVEEIMETVKNDKKPIAVSNVVVPQDSEESFKIELQMIEERDPDEIRF